MKSTFVRRLSAWMMAAVMLLSMVPTMAAFRDTSGHWAEKTLDEWQDKGLIDGYGDGSFQPDGTMTRAEFAKLVNCTLGFTAESAISFSDVTGRDWFYAEVARAAAAGYAQGSGGMFRPNQAVTRAEAAAMLARALDLAANEERANAFTDAASIPAWARGSVGAVAESGYMNGYPDGTFGAGGSITRAEAVVTLDRVLKSAKETVIEAAGTTLENETIPGDLVIAESVGNGNVTLKNVTVLGSVIVKGGGANSVYFDGVRVGGAVRLQKENVHLRLMGDTALERVEVGLPCRVTQDSTFKGSLGTLVIDLEKTSNQKIQIEVPAKLVELLSRANVALHADVEALQINKDAEGAQLDIRRGVTVGELSIDARVALTGSGLVVSLVVSVSGVTVSGTLTVKKTETEGGAKAPTTSGGSSGGGVTLKEIESIVPITAEVPYGTSEADALAALPKEITLNVKDGSTVQTAAAGWSSADYSGTTAGNYTATTSFTVPSGYTYSGTPTAEATVTVKALNTNAFEVALTAAEALIDSTVTDEAAAAADPANKIFVTRETNAVNITEGVRFTTSEAETALTNAVTAATTAQTEGFASQQACDEQTEALTVAVAAFNKTIKTGENVTTNAYILNAAKKWLESNGEQTNYAYDSDNQPLRQGKTYKLPVSASLENDLSVKFEWSKNDSTYLEMQQDNSGGNYSLTVTTVPTEPKPVTFTATVTRYDLNPNGTEVGRIDYTATIGAPIQVNTTAPVSEPPRLTSQINNNITLFIPLSGASAIDYVDDDDNRISVQGLSSEYVSKDATSIKIVSVNGDWTLGKNGLSLPVTASCGSMPPKMLPSSGTPAHAEGKIRVTIPSDALKLKEGSGWYVDGDLTYDAVVWGCNPAVTVTIQGAFNNDNAYRNVSVQIEYAYKNFSGAVAFATTNSDDGAINAERKVRFNASDWTDGLGQDCITCTMENVLFSFDSNTTYYIWCNFNGNNDNDQLNAPGGWMDTKQTIPSTSEAP